MKPLLFILAILCAAPFAGAADTAAPASNAATQAALEWMQVIDGNDFASSWDKAAEYFRNALPKQEWESKCKAVRPPLGKVLSRKVKSLEAEKTLPGAPDGDYYVIEFDTSFENKKTAVERITMLREKDGVWRSVGYFIR